LRLNTDMPESLANEPVPVLQRLIQAFIFGLVGTLVGFFAYNAKMGLSASWIVGISVGAVGFYAAMNLGRAPRELWITFGLKFFIGVAYKLMTVAFTSFLLEDMKVSDGQEQAIFAAWGIWMSVCTLCSGGITDALGLRKTLLIGLIICLLSRIVMVSSDQLWVVLLCGIVPVAMGEALCTPVLIAATRQFTTPTQRSVAFSVIYAVLNMSFMVAYFLRDGITSALVGQGNVLNLGFIHASPREALFIAGVAFEIVALPLVWLMRDERVAKEVQAVSKHWLDSLKESLKEMGKLFGLMLGNKVFHRLLVFLLLIGMLKIVFSLMDSVMPIFAKREMGEEAANSVGRLNAVNSILIMILAPVMGVWTRRFSAYSMVVWGGLLTALSFVFMALPSSLFEGMAAGSLGDWFGRGYLGIKEHVHPYVMMILFWQILLSIGEAIYSPRVSEYAVSIAPSGQEASYASLSTVPMLMSKLIGGSMTAILLPMFMPEHGARNPSAMWMSLGALVALSPFLLLVLRSYIKVKEEGRE